MHLKQLDNIISNSFSSSEAVQTSKNFNTPFISISKKASSRLLNHWEKVGLINDRRIKQHGWRKYSPIEVIWIEIIQTLRSLNFPLENILQLKKQLEYGAEKTKYSKMPLLELAVWKRTIEPGPLKLVIRPTGEPIYQDGMPISYGGPIETTGHFLQIDLFVIMQKLFPDLKTGEENFLVSNLNKEEMDLLSMIRTGQFREFVMETKEGKIKTVKAQELLKDEKLFREIANDYPFQEIKTYIKDGKVVSKKRIVSKKY